MGRTPRYDALDELTPREREVLELLRLGLTDAQIAERISTSRPGASYHVSQIISKLGVQNRHEAAAWPERPPWWLGALAPFAPFAKRALRALPVKSSSLALAAAGAATLAAIGGLALVGFLLVRAGDGTDDNAIAASERLTTPAEGRLLPSRATATSAPTPLPTPLPPAGAAPRAGDSNEGTPMNLLPDIGPAITVTPRPTPPAVTEPHPNCAAFPPQPALIFVTFGADVSIERARKLVAELGAQWSDYQEANAQPLALPIPDAGPSGYVRMINVPAGEEDAFASAFEAHGEVVRAQLDWPLCDDFR